MSESIKLSELEVEINIKNLDKAIEKLEKIKSLICEINDLSDKEYTYVRENGRMVRKHL